MSAEHEMKRALIISTAVLVLCVAAGHADEPTFEVSTAWVGGVLRIVGKTNLPDGTWLNVAIVDENDAPVADEGFIWAQVKGGRFIAEGFTKDGAEPLPPGRYNVSIMNKTSSVSEQNRLLSPNNPNQK